MEQTVNTFSKGLLMDTNPMTQGTDTLTDALNATFITQNGNEVILLNDMGNRRVDSAFLPSGYVPVGIKEYGGIIYIAAYNPLTNKSQIGSFPSPLRKFDDNDSLEKIFDFNQFNNYEEKDGLKYLKSDTFLVPLTDKTSLHAGDKFVIYCNELEEIKDSITNYNNVNSQYKKAISPKNRKYTIYAGILNSQNEFVDITKTLCRWDSDNNLINHDSSYSEIYKFNDGYFICKELNDSLSNTINDSEFIYKRLKYAANTYSYKLIGPMYLKVKLNHIENFNYNLYGIVDNNKLILWVEAFITYNCPDSESNLPSSLLISEDNNYVTYDEINPTIEFFNLINSDSKIVTPFSKIPSKSVYDPNTNLYSVKIVNKYEINNISGKNTYDFTLGVIANKVDDETTETVEDETPKNDYIYLEGLSSKNSLNLSLLGSGKVLVNGWRFYNADNTTILTFSLDAYPEYGTSFLDLTFTFENLTESSNKITYPTVGSLPVYNGRLTLKIDWEANGFKQNAVYKVIIGYNKVEENGNTRPFTIGDNEGDTERWLLTTGLFNEFYKSGSGVSDFCTTENQDFLEKLKLKVRANGNIVKDITERDPIINGSLISYNNPNIEYNCEHIIDLNIKAYPKIEIVDKELYPSYLTVNLETNLNIKINSFSVNKINDTHYELGSTNEILKGLVETTTGKNDISTDVESSFRQKTMYTNDNLITDDLRIYGNILYYYWYIGKGSRIKYARNVFDSVYNVIGKGSPTSNLEGMRIGSYNDENNNWEDVNGTYSGIFLVKLEITGEDDKHWTYAVKGFGPKLWNEPVEEDPTKVGTLLFYTKEDSEDYKCNSKLRDNLEELFTCFDKLLDNNPGLMFTYIFSLTSNLFLKNINEVTDIIEVTPIFTGNTYYYYESSGLLIPYGDKFARVWWRTRNGWALFPKLFNLENDVNSISEAALKSEFEQFIKDLFKYEYVYCMYNTYLALDLEASSLYATDTDFKHYNPYLIPISYKVNYIYDSDNIGESVSGTDIGWGNLKFESPTLLVISSDEINLTLKSSDLFFDTINTFKVNDISGFNLQNGLMVDSDDKPLDINSIYRKKFTLLPDPNDFIETNGFGRTYKHVYSYTALDNFEKDGSMRCHSITYELDNGEWKYFGESDRLEYSPLYSLVKVNKINLKVDFEHLIEDENNYMNTLIYNASTSGNPEYRCDHIHGSEDGSYSLDYTGVNIILDV